MQSSIDAVDDIIDKAIENKPYQAAHTINDGSDDTSTEHHEDAVFSGSCHHSSPNDENMNAVVPRRGDLVAIFWPDDNSHYAGTVRTLHRDGLVSFVLV